jgi:invasion protein IalB
MLAVLFLLAQPATAQESSEVQTFGDWGYKCDSSEDGTQKLCYAFQNVTKKENGQLVLGARIAYRDGQSEPLIVVTVPLGSLLPPGAALMMDGVEPVKMTYFLCAVEGCTTVAAPLPPAMVTAMKKGERAVVRVAAPNNQVVGLPLSLTGFTKAINTLSR